MSHLITASCLAFVLAAPVPDKPKKPEEEPAAQKIRKDLNAAVTIEFVGLPWPQAVTMLKDKTGIDFVLDRTVLEQYFMERNGNGTGLDGAMVTGKLSKVPLRRGLRNLLSEHDLGFVIVGEQVLITTQAMVPTRLLRQPVTVEVEKVPLTDALKRLAHETAVNLVLDSRIAKEGQEKVSLQLEDVALETAVKLLTEQAGLKVVFVDNVLFVTTKQRALEMRDDPDFKPREGPGVVPAATVVPGGAGGGMVLPMVVPPAPPARADKPVKEAPPDKP